MYTGYFAKLKTYEEMGLIPISICAKAPSWYKGIQYKILAPKFGFFSEWKYGSHKGDNNYYIEHFQKEVLDTLNYNNVINQFTKLSDGKLDSVILLCYEKPGDFCHRHLVADWLTKNGLECKEYI
jgi:uncharacterized protein (DUF488 family)